MNKELYLIPVNKNKLYESKFITKFINIPNPNIQIIHYEKNKNINKEIIKSFESNPDIIIINFNNHKNIKIIKNIPRIPIFLNNVFYISPISLKNVNGFNDDINDMTYLINDFIVRIIKLYGSIISDKQFQMPSINYTNYQSGLNKYENNKFLKNYYINSIPEWMTKYIEINNKGWFAKQNKMAIDYVLQNYNINNIVELGTYFGSSAHYTAERKKKEANLYCVDNYDNVLLTDYIVDNPTPLDFEYFFKYFKFESFHAKLSKFSNIYSLKYDCYSIPKLYFDNKIKVDLFYIDFCKIDYKLIKLVDEILELFPEAIIIGDDAVHLNQSLKYFEKEYEYIFLDTCYICSKIPFKNKNNLLDLFTKNKELENIMDYNTIKLLDKDYKINYIIHIIEKSEKDYKKNNSKNIIKNIIDKIIELDINPNETSYYISLNGNLYHYIGMNYWKNDIFYMKLYNSLNKYIIEGNIKNELNLTPNDYFNYISLKNFS